MAKGRKAGPSRLDKRREAEAYEKKQAEEEREDEEEEEEAEETEGDADEGDDEDAKPKKKAKAKKPAAPKKTTTKRSRTAKEVRLRAVWIVFDNASKAVEEFPYNQKAEAEAFLAKKLEEKKGTFYLNQVKKEIKEEK